MQEASLQGILKIILIILCVYYGLKLITRYLGPVLLRYMTKKAGQQFQKHFEQFNQQHQTNHKQQTTSPKSAKKSSKKVVGEYIDFEEIE